MWAKLSHFIYKHFKWLLVATTLFTIGGIFLIKEKGVQYTTTSAQLLPSSDSTMQQFEVFKKHFKSDENVVLLGAYQKDISSENTYQAYLQVLAKIKKLKSVKRVFGPQDAIQLHKDTLQKAYISKPLNSSPKNLAEWRALLEELKKYPFYEEIIYQPKSGAFQQLIFLESSIIDSPQREQLVKKIHSIVKEFEKKNGVNLYLSGMPVIRTLNKAAIQKESNQFLWLSILVTCLTFYLIFRSFRFTLLTVSVVGIAVVYSYALLILLGYKVSLLTALVPPLLIVIGVPNCIYFINKYLYEFRRFQQKEKALPEAIRKAGIATFFTNISTALGFFTFVFTESSTLIEFGCLASLSIVGLYLITLFYTSSVLRLLPSPTIKVSKHLEARWLQKWVEFLVFTVYHRKRWVFGVSIVLALVAVIGISTLKINGNLLDDMSKTEEYYQEISFFDKNFGGILPLEILIVGKPKSATQYATLKKVDELQEFLDMKREISKAVSTVNLIKFAHQAYFENDPDMYEFPEGYSKNFVLRYIKNTKGNTDLLKNYVNEDQSIVRVSVLLSNSSNREMMHTAEEISQEVQQLFQETHPKSFVTGMAYVFMKGTRYLIHNLVVSLSLAIVLISLLMVYLFRSPKMILISLLPNLFPLILTAGLMGYLGIPIKPSTILVFSIAFGIAVDDTIHFLAKYKQELKYHHLKPGLALVISIKETTHSMFFTSIILFLGFSVFVFSGFQGIKALGGLLSVTLLLAMLTNLILLPALIQLFHSKKDKLFTDSDTELLDSND